MKRTNIETDCKQKKAMNKKTLIISYSFSLFLPQSLPLRINEKEKQNLMHYCVALELNHVYKAVHIAIEDLHIVSMMVMVIACKTAASCYTFIYLALS